MRKEQARLIVRFLNFLIDSIIFGILSYIVVSLLVRYHSALQVYNIGFLRFTAFLIYFLYYFICESVFSATPGKLITKSRLVENKTFLRPSVLKIFVRTLCRFIPLEAFSIFFTSNNLVWHDILSKTIVIIKK
jgi:uncharacterized RDD family membrane protein YckC